MPVLKARRGAKNRHRDMIIYIVIPLIATLLITLVAVRIHLHIRRKAKEPSWNTSAAIRVRHNVALTAAWFLMFFTPLWGIWLLLSLDRDYSLYPWYIKAGIPIGATMMVVGGLYEIGRITRLRKVHSSQERPQTATQSAGHVRGNGREKG